VFVPGVEQRGEDLERLTRDAALSRGLGRSYGDSSLPAPGTTAVVGTALADRFLAFDPTSGRMRAEAGLSLATLVRLMLPRGWFTPVSPGTKFVTLGGMVASDVHGKNHHVEGCFGRHVHGLRVRVGSGEVVECGPDRERELFLATVGGMGLTGHILEVEFGLKRVPSPWIWQHSSRIPSIDAFLDGLKEAGQSWPYTVGWIDCISRGRHLGRGILMRGRWAEAHEAPPQAPQPKRPIRFPFELPNWALNWVTGRLFNELYYRKHLLRDQRGIVHPEVFFYPLDAILDWNKAYGRRGFFQYQCVLPDAAGRQAARAFLERLTALGGASPLCVIKDCGPQSEAYLSFPVPGISIAIDMPITRDSPRIVRELNAFVIAHGGRIYLTKDAFTTAEEFAAMEPRLATWQAVRRRWDPEGRLRSAQSVRMLGDAAPAPRGPGAVPAP
jgi:FAD/FMN-containing dehydrogenase